METQTNQFKIGAFIMIGMVVIMATIFFLGADKSIMTKYVRLHAHFNNVAGLSEGSVVALSGVNIGNVEEIKFNPEANSLDVRMKIEERFLFKVTEGTSAEIRTQGALGDKYIYLVPGPTTGQALKDGDQVNVDETGGILDIISNRGKDTERVFDIINEIYKMTKAINNENRIERIIGNLQSTSANLNNASAEIKKFSNAMNDDEAQKKFKSGVVHMESILSKIDKGEGTLGALVNDPSLHEKLKSLLGADQRKVHVRSLLRSSIQKSDDGK